jgi:hypothetical protein
MRNRTPAQNAGRAVFTEIKRELVALDTLTVGELALKYRDLFGRPTKTRNKAYLQKHIAWRIQEVAEGGLSPRALDQIEQLAPHAPARWRRPVVRQPVEPRGRGRGRGPAADTLGPDPRLPPVGTVLKRHHAGVDHRVTVLADGFEYEGARHKSLSKIALLITGKSWNGYVFFLGREAGEGASSPKASSPKNTKRSS